MKNLSFLLLFISLAALQMSAALPDSTLRRYATQMLMVGFRGDSITCTSDAARYIRDLKVGGIILFDVDLTGSAKIGSRNITSREQLKKLTSDLRSYADYDLLIAVDQEGGRVCRLKTEYGFNPTVSAEHLGKIDNRDTTSHYAAKIAAEMADVGLNVNLAPDIDVNTNPECPVISKLHRSFSSDTAVVARNAEWFIDEHHSRGILCAVKHFPGHGSATADSHYGLTDVTKTWHPSELAPFKYLINKGKIDMVMTAHIFNRNFDNDYPATLSKTIINDLLRHQLGYDGIVLTDDMYMQGIIDNYDIRHAIILAINAGADMLILGNNISTGFEPDRPFKIVNMIIDAVKKGEINENRIIESHERIERLKEKLF